MKNGKRITLCALLCVSLGGVAAAQKYTVTDLGVLSGDSSSLGTWINNLGHVSGCSDPSAETFPCVENTDGQHAFLWTRKTGLKDLGALPGGNISQPYGMNDSDEMVGYSFTNEGTSHAFRWFRKTGMQDLGTLAGGATSLASSLNSLGEIVGWSDYEGSSGKNDAVLWDKGGAIHDLGKVSGAVGSSSAAINKQHQVVGINSFGGGVFHAFFWSQAKGMQDLGTLAGGSESFAGFINDNGLIVGGGDSSKSPGIQQCVMWDKQHKIHLLASFKGGCGLFDMSDKNEAVGQGTDASGNGFAVSWSQKTGIRNLNKEIPRNSGWTLTAADSVNDHGQIVGWGVINGATHAFLLAPKK